MEFQYKKLSLIWFTVLLFLVAASMSFYVMEIFKGEFHMEQGVIGSIAFFLTGLIGTKYYASKLNAVVFVDDEGIAYKNKAQIFMRWKEVKEAEVLFISRFYQVYKDSFVITLKSDSNELNVGSEIKDVYKLVSFMKSKLGNKLDTKEIPIECKIKQR